MKTIAVNSKGQILIPAKIRNKYGIKNGTKINIIEEEDGITIIPVTYAAIEKGKGLFKTGGKLLKTLREEKKNN